MLVIFRDAIQPLSLITSAAPLIVHKGNYQGSIYHGSDIRLRRYLSEDYHPPMAGDYRSLSWPSSSVPQTIQRLFALYQMGLTAHPDAMGSKREEWRTLRDYLRQSEERVGRQREVMGRLLAFQRKLRMWQPQLMAMDKFEQMEELRYPTPVPHNQSRLDEHDDPVMAACRACLTETRENGPPKLSEVDEALIKIQVELSTLYQSTQALQENISFHSGRFKILTRAIIDEYNLLEATDRLPRVMRLLKGFLGEMAIPDNCPKQDEPVIMIQTVNASRKRSFSPATEDSSTTDLPFKRLATGEVARIQRESDNVPILHSVELNMGEDGEDDVHSDSESTTGSEDDDLSEQDVEQRESGTVAGFSGPCSIDQFLSVLHFGPSLLISRFRKWVKASPAGQIEDIEQWASNYLQDDFLEENTGLEASGDGDEEAEAEELEHAYSSTKVELQGDLQEATDQTRTLASIVESIVADLHHNDTSAENPNVRIGFPYVPEPILQLPKTASWRLWWQPTDLSGGDTSSSRQGHIGIHDDSLESESGIDYLLQETAPPHARVMSLREAWPTLTPIQKHKTISILAQLLLQVWRHYDFVGATTNLFHAPDDSIGKSHGELSAPQVFFQQGVDLSHPNKSIVGSSLALSSQGLADDARHWDYQKEVTILTSRLSEMTFETAMHRLAMQYPLLGTSPVEDMTSSGATSTVVPESATTPSLSLLPAVASSSTPSSHREPELVQGYSGCCCSMTTTAVEAHTMYRDLTACYTAAFTSVVPLDNQPYPTVAEEFDFSLDDLQVQLLDAHGDGTSSDGLPAREPQQSSHQHQQHSGSDDEVQDANEEYLESLIQQLVIADSRVADMWTGTRQEKEAMVYHRWMAAWHQRVLWRLSPDASVSRGVF
ncbi:hypothetical protein BGZ73_000885 [Actinomortierella ambigua]|nr:hypothetical protein BGZ73_000885 [Actinomortierella ambigua]